MWYEIFVFICAGTAMLVMSVSWSFSILYNTIVKQRGYTNLNQLYKE